MAAKFQSRSWTKDNFFISTDPSKIPLAKLNAFFASEDIYWTTSIPEDALQQAVQNSLSFGLYETGVKKDPADAAGRSDNFIGIARFITDFTTFGYLTDVYVLPAYQGKGLGSWMVKCIQEVIDSMPYLRRAALVTGDWERSVPFYEKIMGMQVVAGRKTDNDHGGVAVMMSKGRGHPDFRG